MMLYYRTVWYIVLLVREEAPAVPGPVPHRRAQNGSAHAVMASFLGGDFSHWDQLLYHSSNISNTLVAGVGFSSKSNAIWTASQLRTSIRRLRKTISDAVFDSSGLFRALVGPLVAGIGFSSKSYAELLHRGLIFPYF